MDKYKKNAPDNHIQKRNHELFAMIYNRLTMDEMIFQCYDAFES